MPEWRVGIQRRLSLVRVRPEREAEIVDELAQHLEDRYRASLAAGRSSQDSELLAWDELDTDERLGRELSLLESAAPIRLAAAEAPMRRALVSGLRQDFGYSVRALRQRPLFTLTAIVAVAMSVGPAIAVCAVTDALFFRPLPAIADQSRLLTFQFGQASGESFAPWSVSYANLAEITTGATMVTGLAGQQPVSVAIAADGAASRLVTGESVTANYFDLLGVRLASGRNFRPEEDRGPGGAPVVVLDEALARDQFPGESPIGRMVHLNSLPFEVIGVTPAGFQGTIQGLTAKLWITGMTLRQLNHAPPETWAYETNRGPFYEFIARVAPAASPDQVAAELSAKTRALADADPMARDLFTRIAPKMMPGFGAPLSLNPTGIGTVRLLLAVAALLVLLGIANVANLLIFQALATGREIAIRKALGASARRILQLRLVQSLLLSFVGTSIGVGVAVSLGLLLSDFNLPGLGPLNVLISWRVASVSALLAFLVGIGFGAAPAVLAARASLSAALARGERPGLPRAARLRHGLTIVQLALSLTLLIGALLFLVTLRHLHAVDLGLDTSNVTTVQVNLRIHGYTQPRALDYHRRLIESVRHSPGFDAVAVTSGLPLSGMSFSARVYESGGDPSRTVSVLSNAVSSDYFRVFAMPLVSGRVFTDDEAFQTTSGTETPIVVSETLARRVFGSIDVVGRRLTVPQNALAPMHNLDIVGVVGEAHWRGVLQPPDPILYEPVGRTALRLMGAALVVRGSLGRAEVAKRLQTAGAAIDPSIPLSSEQAMDDAIDRQLGQQRLFAWVFGVLAVVGFVLAAAGLYGLVAQSVSERAREFGIRMAIGADSRQVLKLVLHQASVVAATGTVVGLGLGWVSGRAIESQLFGVTSHDPLVYVIAAGLLTTVVFAASLGPARAATRVNPVDVLRSE